jgi:hypothetical protein
MLENLLMANADCMIGFLDSDFLRELGMKISAAVAISERS